MSRDLSMRKKFREKTYLGHPKALNPSNEKKHQNYSPTCIHLTKLFFRNLNCQKKLIHSKKNKNKMGSIRKCLFKPLLRIDNKVLKVQRGKKYLMINFRKLFWTHEFRETLNGPEGGNLDCSYSSKNTGSSCTSDKGRMEL